MSTVPVLLPVRPGVSTVSYAGIPAREIPERTVRHRAHHAAAMTRAAAARAAGDRLGHVRALRDAALARLQLTRVLADRRALDVIYFDRPWFYVDDPELARRRALIARRPSLRLHFARSRGEDVTYIERRRAARS